MKLGPTDETEDGKCLAEVLGFARDANNRMMALEMSGKVEVGMIIVQIDVFSQDDDRKPSLHIDMRCLDFEEIMDALRENSSKRKVIWFRGRGAVTEI